MYGTIGEGWFVRKRLEVEVKGGVICSRPWHCPSMERSRQTKKLLKTSILNTGYQLWVLNYLSFYHIK
jgi:hypothetical protein